MRIVIANLPDGATEEGLRDALTGIAPVEAIHLVMEGSAPSAIIEMEMTKLQADALAKRVHGRMYQGRELRAWVPVMPWK
jgi:hypothetical protein